ncbi:hypothetical protein Ddc_14016 [Ditylenchus destructor]|nr:hypothetical protein Ddc_14016 [Ditylenchus destructor]
MAYFFRLLLAIAFAQIFFGSSSACSCRVFDEGKGYCNAEWVSRVFIQAVGLETITRFNYWKYTVKHVHTYKSSVEQLPTVIVTAEHGVIINNIWN